MVKAITQEQILADEQAVNDVRLVGTVRAVPEARTLPSGDELVTFRLTVERPPATRGERQRAQTVDSVPCTVWVARVRRSVLTWRPGDVVTVGGAVRCRFYQAGGATRSRVEVEVSSARVIRRSRAS
ncbi:single-stranded DNA-binding protein [Nocardioides zeicaulis]|uniref:Single-stranded DNA-binding protein n=1 Tax=Nocardioides zeicaulis TaxID=1776857 RepID=A0ABV6E786_9ACTN